MFEIVIARDNLSTSFAKKRQAKDVAQLEGGLEWQLHR
jgi:hypothetical protein